MGAFQTVQASFPTLGLWVICGDRTHTEEWYVPLVLQDCECFSLLGRQQLSSHKHPSQNHRPRGFGQVLSSSCSFRKEELRVHPCRDVCLHSIQCMSTMWLRTGKQVEFCTNKGPARQELEMNMVGASLSHFPLTDLLVCACLKCSLLQMDRMD